MSNLLIAFMNFSETFGLNELILSKSFSKRMERTRGDHSGYDHGTGPAPLSILGSFLLTYCKSVPVKNCYQFIFLML